MPSVVMLSCVAPIIIILLLFLMHILYRGEREREKRRERERERFASWCQKLRLDSNHRPKDAEASALPREVLLKGKAQYN